MPKSKKRKKLGYRRKFHYRMTDSSDPSCTTLENDADMVNDYLCETSVLTGKDLSRSSTPEVHLNTFAAVFDHDYCYGPSAVSEELDSSGLDTTQELDTSLLDAYACPDVHSHEFCLDALSSTDMRESLESSLPEEDRSCVDQESLHTSEQLDSGIALDDSLTSTCTEDLTSHVEQSVDHDDYADLKHLLKDVVKAPFQLMNTNNGDIRILELYHSGSKSVVKLTVTIGVDYTATISVHHKELPSTHDLWTGLPQTFNTTEKITLLLSRLKTFSVCVGNSDDEFQDLVPVGAGISDSEQVQGHDFTAGQLLAYREGDFCASQGNLSYNSTIRSLKCCMLIQGARCGYCSTIRRFLRRKKLKQNQLDDKENISNNHLSRNLKQNFKHCNMSTEMLKEKLTQQKKQIKNLQSELDVFRRKFDKEILRSGVTFNDAQNMEMCDLVSSCSGEMQKAYVDPNSLQRLFWEQQKKFNASGRNGMRWHPMIIKWCLYLRHRSAKAYEAMRDGGFVNLPSARTLFDYSHYTKSAIGYSTDVVKVLKEEASKRNMYSSDESWRGYVGILFDELKIKEDLVYDKHTGELVGYCDLDSVGNKFMELEHCLNGGVDRTGATDIAKYVMIVMVRGVTSNLKFPLAAFATNSITADFLYPIIWKAIHILENIDLKVLFLTCDGASSNRRFFKLHTLNGHGFVHYTDNPYDSTRKIYFVSDVPHLLKTTRNCFSNSFSHRMSRQMWKEGKDLSWMHIVRLYEEHCEMNLYSPCPELSRSHIDLTAFTCMKVKLAAQVMSDSVANALEELYDGQVLETVKFIRNINKFFDCLNVRNLFEGRNKRNPNLGPYTQANDERLDWLQQDFLGYLDTWKLDVENRPGNFTSTQRAGMLLSYQTLEGLRISVKSIVACVRLMLNMGAQFILTHSFNQDPLEEHFGHHRHKGGASDNPTVYDVRNALTQIRSVNVNAFAPRNGNVLQNREGVINIDNSSLPKRNAPRN